MMSPAPSSDALGVEKGEMVVLSDGFQPNENKTISDGGYKVDPFARQAAVKTEDYVEFRTMGWVQAAFVATAEVTSIPTSPTNTVCEADVTRASPSVSYPFRLPSSG
jgi:hypothetical protein